MTFDPQARRASFLMGTGLAPDTPDTRDYLWRDRPEITLPSSVDQRHLSLGITNQDKLSCCVAEAVTSSSAALTKGAFLNAPGIPLSVLQNYRHACDYDPATYGQDKGTSARNGLKAAYRAGIAPESAWPFDESKVLAAIPPEVDTLAANNKASRYERLKNFGEDVDYEVFIRRIREALYTGHLPLLGMGLTAEYFSLGKSTPHNYLGGLRAGSVIDGYHEQFIVGYYSIGVSDYLLVENSWSPKWGADGYAHLPAYAVHYDSLDVWAVTEFAGVNIEAAHNARKMLAQFYVALFGRAPDTQGMAYWLNTGLTPAAIVEAMFATEPARAYYPSGVSTGDTVAAFYRNVLGREADAEGLRYWMDKMQANGLGGTIVDMCALVDNYAGTDPRGIASAAYFNGRVRKAQVWAESGGGIEGSDAALH